jgi:amidohydrolase
MELKELFRDSAENLSDQLSAWRRYIHAHPELSYKEVETMKYIAGELSSMGIKFEEGVANTGLVGIIEGENPNSRIIALRSDHDALPIVEQNEVEYASKNPGVMHACGHDVHTASLLGAAHILNEHKNSWEGTIKLIFQPGEERLPGGASLMIEAGVLENPIPQHIIGEHVFPDLPAGHVGMRPGTYMASADEIHLTINGKGGHAALPKGQCNPLLVASEVLLALEKLIDERGDKEIKTVLAFGFIEGKGATNVIPNSVRLEGTFRSLDEKWRFKVHDEMRYIVNEICKRRKATANLDIRVGYPSVYNDPDLTVKMKELAIEYLGEDKVHDLPERMTAEDFSFYAREIPGCFYRLGTASHNSELGHHGLHTPLFDVDESALKVGAGLMAYAAVKT